MQSQRRALASRGYGMRPEAVAAAVLVAAGLIAAAVGAPEDAGTPPLAALGERLFHDTSLSRDRTLSCAGCHDPSRGFVDGRSDPPGSVSVGDDGRSLGVRNAPTITYAAKTPAFHSNGQGIPVGGFFLDGRAATLEAQAGGPLLNPVEMAMPDEASVVARLLEDPQTAADFRALFGDDVFDDTGRAFAALETAIAAYERQPSLSSFDSKYDRALRGETVLSEEEELGRILFFSAQFTNCHLCHKLTVTGGEGEIFSNHRFHNIGVPANPNGSGTVDLGLGGRDGFTEEKYRGQFKVPSLRNVAVTPPYMHNGVFRDLRTAVLFYNRYNSVSPRRQINPETGEPWGEPDVPGSLSLKELETGPALDDRRVDALVAFLKTLTDARYEPLLER